MNAVLTQRPDPRVKQLVDRLADTTTDTGRRLNLSPLAMPRNVAEKPIDPTEWNRNDGFSPGQMAVTMVPGLDAGQ